MVRSGYSRTPVVLPGVLIQIMFEMGIPVPNIVPFQFNPEKITRGIEPWNPFATDPQNQAAQTPLTQPFDPRETYGFELQFNGIEDIEMNNPISMATGVASRLAALKKLVLPTEGLFGDLIASANALSGATGDPDAEAEPRKVPLVLLVMGPGLAVPVRITELSIEVTEFTAQLYPLMAKATLSLQVLTPDAFKCSNDERAKLANAAYNFTKLQEDALAIANISNVATAAGSMIPV